MKNLNKVLKVNKFAFQFSKGKNYLREALGLMFSVILIYTGIIKFNNLEAFYSTLWKSNLFHSDFLISVIAFGLPVLELILGVLLLFKKLQRVLSIVVYGLFSLFLGYSILLYSFNINSCGCGGFFSFLDMREHLVVNTIFFLFSLLYNQLSLKMHS